MTQRHISQTLQWLVFLCLLAALATPLVGAPATAQDEYVPITRENASEIVQISRLGNGAVRMFALSDDHMYFAIATSLGVWTMEVDRFRGVGEMSLFEGQGGASSARFNPDAALIAGGGDDGSVMVWDRQTGETVTRLENHLYPISALAWSDDGALLASGDWSGIVRVWDVATWSEYRVFAIAEVFGVSNVIERLGFNQELLVVQNSGGLTVWNVTNADFIPVTEVIARLGVYPFGLSDEWVDPLWQRESGQIEMYDNVEQVDTLSGFHDQLGGVFFTEDGRVGASTLPSPHLWSLETGEAIDPPSPQALSPDESIMATFGNDGIIRLLNWETQEQIAALYGHIRKINAVAFSPDGSLLVSASDDGTIQVWDATVTEDSGSLMTLEGHTSGVTSVAFNAEGTLIASTGYDGTVRTWGVHQ